MARKSKKKQTTYPVYKKTAHGKPYAFVVSDIHGHSRECLELLKHWKPKEQQLVFIGDYIDKGYDSYNIVELMMYLVKKYQAIVLKGNHDEAFVSAIQKNQPFFIDKRTQRNYENHINRQHSIEPHSASITELIQTYTPQHLLFLRKLRTYWKWGHVLFTHAGYDTQKQSWCESHNHDFLWIRRHYLQEPRTMECVNVFGHTPTPIIRHEMHELRTHEVWVSPTNAFIGIDGHCHQNGQLNAIVLDKTGHIHHTYAVPNFHNKTPVPNIIHAFEEQTRYP